MLNGQRVILYTVAGRRRYLPIISHYVHAERGVIDEWHLWINTKDEEDIKFMEGMERASDGFIKTVQSNDSGLGEIGSMGGIRSFYRNDTIEPDTVYLRVDDDIVYVDDHAFETLARFRIDNPDYFLITANMTNTGLCSHLHQRMGLFPRPKGKFDIIPWTSEGGPLHWSVNMATIIHDQFIKDIIAGNLEPWKAYERWELWESPRFGIACCAFFGRDILGLIDGWEGEDDEIFFTEIYPPRIGRINCICGKALIGHYAYCPQRNSGLESQTVPVIEGDDDTIPANILNRFRKLAGVACE